MIISGTMRRMEVDVENGDDFDEMENDFWGTKEKHEWDEMTGTNFHTGELMNVQTNVPSF